MIKRLIVTTLLPCLLLTGCLVDPYTGEPRITNAGFGAVLGAAAGGAMYGSTFNSGSAAVLGAGMGAIAGSLVGSSVDQQEALFRQRLRRSQVKVVRSHDDIRLIMPGDITFANDQAHLNPYFYDTLNEIAGVLRHFRGTAVRVVGHSSSTGSPMYNQRLSERRAEAVADYLNARGVSSQRIFVLGYGSRYPVADNRTNDGRALNRRVEIKVHPVD